MMIFWWLNQTHMPRLVIMVLIQNGVPQQKNRPITLDNMLKKEVCIIF